VTVVVILFSAWKRKCQPHESGQHDCRDDQRDVGDDERDVRDAESATAPTRIEVSQLELDIVKIAAPVGGLLALVKWSVIFVLILFNIYNNHNLKSHLYRFSIYTGIVGNYNKFVSEYIMKKKIKKILQIY
jgi:hypothetical protein